MEICDAMVSSGLRDAGCESCPSVTTARLPSLPEVTAGDRREDIIVILLLLWCPHACYYATILRPAHWRGVMLWLKARLRAVW
jgi:hypothetical protein